MAERRAAGARLVAAATPGPAAALAALVGGLLAPLTVPPFDLGWLAWVAFVPLFVTLAREPPAAAAACGVLSGLVMFTAIGYGTYAFDPGVCALVIGGLTASLAAVFGLTAALERAARPWLRVLLLPSLWVLSERLATAANAPWSAALSQTAHLPLIQSAALLGAGWISFLILLITRALAYALEALWPGRGRDERRATAVWALALAALAGSATLGYGHWALGRIEPAPRTVRVAAIQPVIHTHEYRYEGLLPAYRARNLAAVARLTDQALARRPQLLIWPEGGEGLFSLRVPARRQRLRELAAASGAGLLISSYDLDRAGRLYNSVFSIDSAGDLLGRYDKVALTPVGERDFTAGTRWAPLPTRVGPVGTLVCFESVFAAPARAMVRRGALLLLVSTSDAAFRHSSLAALHARSAIYRAVENRRDLVQAANTGPSMLVAASGAVRAVTPFFRPAVLEGIVGLRRTRSVYARVGDAPLLALCAAAPLLAAAAALRRHRRAGAAAPRAPLRPLALAGLGVVALALGAALAVASLRLSAAGVPSLPTWQAALAAFVRAPAVPLRTDAAEGFRQRRPNSCGPAALAYLATYLGAELDEAAVTRHLTLRADGTSLADLATAARRLGFDAWGERQNLAALRATRKPVVAHIRDDHYVVVLATDDGLVDLFDPSAGYVRVAAGTFEQSWRGNVLIVRFRELLR